MTDQSLSEIGKRRPQSLSLIQCHGNKVSAQGLRELFRHCAESLQVSVCVFVCLDKGVGICVCVISSVVNIILTYCILFRLALK